MVPVVTIWVGVFPMRVNFWLALASTIFFSINNMVLYYFKQFSCAPWPRNYLAGLCLLCLAYVPVRAHAAF